MDNIKKFEDFLDRMQGLLDNAKKQGHIIVRVEDLEKTFPELREEESKEKPNGGIVMEDFNEDNGFYKVNLNYLNKEQVEEIEELVKKWNPELKESEDEKIRNGIIKYLSYIKDRDGSYMPNNIPFDDMIAWLEKQGEQKSTDKIKPKFKVGDKVIGIVSDMQYYITDVCYDHYYTESGCIIMFCSQDNFKLVEQKPAWSEEDDMMVLGVEQLCTCASFLNILPDKISKVKQWLKSLKERLS